MDSLIRAQTEYSFSTDHADMEDRHRLSIYVLHTMELFRVGTYLDLLFYTPWCHSGEV